MQLPNFKEILNRFTRKQLILYGSSGFTALIFLWFLFGGRSKASTDVVISPTRGEFIVATTVTGELQAKNSIEIKAPEQARTAGLWQMKISNLVPEGTVVKKGQFVAELDKAEIANRLKESELSVQKYEAQFLQAKLDSMLVLSQSRDELINMQYTKEEKNILLEQSAYEAPAIRRQAQIDYDRADRSLVQAKKNYITKTKQAIAKIQVVEADLMKERQRRDIMQNVIQQFKILAPADGMVVYAREWSGKKIIVGSQVDTWRPTVATLPDFSVMESVTYVNEVDIQKISAGQSVKIRLDADPKKILSGKVTGVANIGEQRPNSDSKVFEVRILVNEADTTLRPSMTTANEILIAERSQVLSIPLETVHTEGTTTFVYLKNGSGAIKQEVKLGLQNENEAIVLEGVKDDDEVYLSQPLDAASLTLRSLKAT